VIDVKIDQFIPDAIGELFSQDMLEEVLDDLSEGAYAKWRGEARKSLGSSKEDYIRGIQPRESQQGQRVIVLVGWLPNAIENGKDPFDLRTTVLGAGSRTRKESADGHFYASVPFRHKTPGATSMAGAPMGSSYGPRGGAYAGTIPDHMGSAGARGLGNAIYKKAKKLEATTRWRSRGGHHWGGKLEAGLAPILRPPRPEHRDPRMRRGHKTDIYAGMVRVREKYQKATQTQYMTFRTISTRVPDGWIHPGINARNLAAKVEEWVSKNARAALINVFQRQK